jgi:hypothetical protein
MLRITGLCFLAVALYGCVYGQPLSKDVDVAHVDEAYYVFGLTPSNYKVQIYPGSKSSDGRFQLNQFLTATFNSVADNGYAVGKAKAGSVLAITRVYMPSEGSIINPPFLPCGDAKTLVFTAVGGKVLYLTDVDYRFSGEKLEVSYKSNIESAKKYLEGNYPKLAPLLEQGEFHFSKTHMSCGGGTTYIPVYLPR